VVSKPLPSSTVITPSFPTLSIASAIILPVDGSLFAEMAAIWEMSFFDSTGRESSVRATLAALTDLRIPETRFTGLTPAVRYLRPSLKIASAMTVAVVVPSPATLDVFEAASLIRRAPMFS